MNELANALARATTDLDRTGADWALVGGLAVSQRAEPRFTRDVDLAVAVADDTEAEGVVRSLMMRGYSILTTVDQYVTDRLATVRLQPPDTLNVVIDLLFASSGVEAEIAAQAERLEVFPGIRVPVARTGHLIAVKILARDDEQRPQDYADIRALLSVAKSADIELAQSTVDLIARRGFNRDRDLAGALELLLEKRAHQP